MRCLLGRSRGLIHFLGIACLILNCRDIAPGTTEAAKIPIILRIFSAEISSAQGEVPTLRDQKSILTSLEEALARKQTDAAHAALEELLGQPNLTPDVLLEAGVNLAQSDLYEEAGRAFSRCVQDYPAIFEGYYNLALSKLALGKLAEAFDTIERAAPHTADERTMQVYLRGKIEDAQGRFSPAERDLRAAFDARPQQENYALDLGILYMERQDYTQAIKLLKAGATPNSSSFVYFGLALAEFLGGSPSDSIKSSQRALEIDPELSPARTLLGFVLSIQGRYEEASQISGVGLNNGTSYPYLYYVHALAKFKMQSTDYPGMLKDLAFAEQNIPLCSLCYLSQAKVHQTMGDRKEAIADLELAVHFNPKLSDAWYRLASLYHQTGKERESLDARAKFERLKAGKNMNDTEIMGNAFLEAIGANHKGPPSP